MKKAFNYLDDQAKMIVKTDVEINRAQEFLDKRLSALDTLQKTSRLISTTLDENEIFHRLKQALTTDLGFEKGLIFILDDKKNCNVRIASGLSEEEIFYITGRLEKETDLLNALKDGNTFSSPRSPFSIKEKILQIFQIEHFVLSPVLAQSGMIGAVFVGNKSNIALSDGDEEFISILANQIGQALENARLFDQVYSSSQLLELKVQERTRQLESALTEVKQISKTKSEFISAVSHELRTPLTSIKGYASILIAGKLGNVPDAVKQRLEKINIHSDNLVKLINDLLDISRIESGKVEMTMEKCRLSEMIDNVHDLLTPQIKEKSINWRMDVDPKIPDMFLDKQQAERIFINLIGNAIKFTPENGTISVKVILQDNNMVKAEVTDTGIGIPKDAITKLFDEFYRVENEINENVKGTGLGLPLAKKIVEAHGGSMWVTSKVGEGTSFHFTIPVKTEQ